MISLKKLLRLNEELVGDIKGYEVYKNPKSIKRMENDLRGISFPNGDLFVVDDSMHIIHSRFARWLTKNGYKIPVAMDVKGLLVEGIKEGYITWQRKYSSESFYLGESINFDDPMYFNKKELMPYLKKYSKKVKSKNPKYKFILEAIGTIY